VSFQTANPSTSTSSHNSDSKTNTSSTDPKPKPASTTSQKPAIRKPPTQAANTNDRPTGPTTRSSEGKSSPYAAAAAVHEEYTADSETSDIESDGDDESDQTSMPTAIILLSGTRSKKRTEQPAPPELDDSQLVVPEEPPVLTGSAKLWHNRLGHVGDKVLESTAKYYGLKIPSVEMDNMKSCACMSCETCKAQRQPIGRKTADRLRVATAVMDCFHVDLMGPYSSIEEGRRIRISSFDANSYLLVMVDEYSRFVMVTPLQRKSKATESIIATV